MQKTGIYWFSHDLRINDNAGLKQASEEVNSLICIYILDPSLLKATQYQSNRLGRHRKRFLLESLEDLRLSLEQLGQHLLVINDSVTHAFEQLMSSQEIHQVYRSHQVGFDERREWDELKETYQNIQFIDVFTHRIFQKTELPFVKDNWISSFTKFRKLVEPLNIQSIRSKPKSNALTALPKPANLSALVAYQTKSPLVMLSKGANLIRGGETFGQLQLNEYFSSKAPQSYKDRRNELDNWQSSTKFSAWLANGTLSTNQVIAALADHEDKFGANDSTYWIGFELLWREYFQWYAFEHGSKLFSIGGIKNQKPLNCFYPERFRRWCDGTTPYPIVNACMRQLNSTGYMSNRGRQIVASCFVHELGLDWRYGAAYFEQQLIDYDVGSNWGNWQYLAGVGADPRGHRHFDLQKQTDIYDPDQRFIKKWNGNDFDGILDSNDAADWPIGY